MSLKRSGTVTPDGENIRSWVSEELKTLKLGHASRVKSAKAVLTMLARGAGTKVTDFTTTSAERQQAYGFIENNKVNPEALTDSAADAAFHRADQLSSEVVLVPVDGTSLELTDEKGNKDFGGVGPHKSTRGLQVQTALLITKQGTPLGILAQRFWARRIKESGKGALSVRRKTCDKETHHWVEIIRTVERASLRQGSPKQLWFQCDRGYDCSPLLDLMANSSNLFTIRGEYDRALWSGHSEADIEMVSPHKMVKEALDAVPIIATIPLEVRATPGRKARTAHLEIQVVTVKIRLVDRSRRTMVKTPNGKKKQDFTWPQKLTALRVREVGTAPENEAPLEWMLWHNREVESPEQACEVVRAYSMRWRVEDFHKLWKSGAMKVEETQVRSGANAERVARMAALVATNLLRWTHLARETPDVDAALEFSQVELTVLKHMDPRSPKQLPRTEKVNSLAWVVAILADLGGYTGKSSGGPPGAFVLSRGFLRFMDYTAGFTAAMASGSS